MREMIKKSFPYKIAVDYRWAFLNNYKDIIKQKQLQKLEGLHASDRFCSEIKNYKRNRYYFHLPKG